MRTVPFLFISRVCSAVRDYDKAFDVYTAKSPKTLRDGFSITRRRRNLVKSSYRMRSDEPFRRERLTPREMRDFGRGLTESKWLLYKRKRERGEREGEREKERKSR